MLESGYIKLYRSLLNWEWYDDINTKTVFLHLLLTVNIAKRQWHGITVQPSDFEGNCDSFDLLLVYRHDDI